MPPGEVSLKPGRRAGLCCPRRPMEELGCPRRFHTPEIIDSNPIGATFDQGSVTMRDVTLVSGPPCGGKSTYVNEHAGEGDLIVCLDALAQAAGSPFEHDHSLAHFAAARARWSELLDEVAAADDARAWVIRCAPLPAERVELARRVRADRTLVLLPPLEEALRRARVGRHPKIKGSIHWWYRRYEPGPGDTLLTAHHLGSRNWG